MTMFAWLQWQLQNTRDWTRQAVTESDNAGQITFDRVWRDTPEGRLSLHRFQPAPADVPLYWHPHTQPMIVAVVAGAYELHVDRVRAGMPSAQTTAVIHAHGPFVYALTDAEAWHAVRPRSVVHSVVLVSPPADWLQPDALAAWLHADRSVSLSQQINTCIDNGTLR